MASLSSRRSRSPASGRDSPARSSRRSISPRSRSASRSRSRTPRSVRRNGRTRSLTRSRSPSRGRDRTRSISRSRSRSRSSSPPRSAKIVIEMLTKNVNEEHLREIFGTYGTVQDIDMPVHSFYKQSRGTAYILYSTCAAAEDAVAHMHEAQIDSQQINVSIVLPRRRFSPSPPPRTGYSERPPLRERDTGYGRGGRGGGGRFGRSPDRFPRGGGYGGRGGGRGGRPDSDVYIPRRDSGGRDRRERSYTRSRSRSPPRRGGRGYTRSPSYNRSRSPPRRRGGYGRRNSPPRDNRGRGGAGGRGGRRRSRSRSYDSYSSRRSRSYTRSRSRDRGGRRR